MKPKPIKTVYGFTPKEILSAYTGVLMCGFARMHEYIETILGHSLFTHELASDETCKRIKKAILASGDLQRALDAIEDCRIWLVKEKSK